MVCTLQCGGHAVWTLVSATCSLHLALSLLGDACVVRSGSRHSFRLTLAQESGHLWFDSVTNVIIFDIALKVFKLQTVGVCQERSWWAHLPIRRLPDTCL